MWQKYGKEAKFAKIFKVDLTSEILIKWIDTNYLSTCQDNYQNVSKKTGISIG